MTFQRYWLVLLLFLHTVNTYMDRICISTAKDAMQADIRGLTDQRMGYAFGIFAVGYALFQIPAGWYSDRAGPRRALTVVVIVWSFFTALTGAVYTAMSLLIVRFLFGVGEAGAYPGATRALYTWLPAKERGLGQGIFHSGARIGAAASLVLMPEVIRVIGWRWTFVLNAVIGIVWGVVWWCWYRDNPADHKSVSQAELQQIESGIAEGEAPDNSSIPYIQIVTSSNVLLAMFQYAASNITFFHQYDVAATLYRRYMGRSIRMVLIDTAALWRRRALVFRLPGDNDAPRRLADYVTTRTGDDWLFAGCSWVTPMYANSGIGVRLAVHCLLFHRHLWRRDDVVAELGLLHGHRRQSLRRGVRRHEHGR